MDKFYYLSSNVPCIQTRMPSKCIFANLYINGLSIHVQSTIFLDTLESNMVG